MANSLGLVSMASIPSQEKRETLLACSTALPANLMISLKQISICSAQSQAKQQSLSTTQT